VTRRAPRGQTLPLAAAAALVLAWILLPAVLRDGLRERAADQVLSWAAPPPADDRVVLVDIDSASLASLGAWPWPRQTLARLLEAIAATEPAVIVLDILLEEADRLSPAALARRLAALTGRAEFDLLAATLPDGDAALAAAMGQVPTILGLLPAATMSPAPATVPVLRSGAAGLRPFLAAPGMRGPPPELAAQAAGLGLLALEEDVDGRIRRLPLLAAIGGEPMPGLAVEAVRLATGASALLLQARPLQLVMGDAVVPLDASASLRLRPGVAERWQGRAMSAAALLAEPGAAAARLAGRIVLVGGSAPELGGARPAAGGEVATTLHLQAEGIARLLDGGGPIRPAWLPPLEAAAAALLALLAVALPFRLSPRRAAGLVGLALLLWCGAAVLMLAGPFPRLLMDPIGPPLLALVAYGIAALASAIGAEQRARALRTRFEQHLAPEVVRRIAAAPGSLRLAGETRDITAFFTDIEGFTAMTERAAATDLVALLDAYLDATTAIVIAHGGLVEKIVGDAIHAVFGAPVALPDHPARAVACAAALLRAAEAQRETPLGQRLGLGRTRIGIESGPAIVGDVGGSRKLDYTAHGTVMNTAARLEAANKTLGSAICIGPEAASRLGPAAGLVSLGHLALRGRSGELEVFTPAAFWPPAGLR
jgi:adenylate cyclase